ncbi:alpha/beta hydrolase [Pelagicoccus sp. SDUM812003]|uniref:alpha/beta fold hydrolase n=1 Tax=Pelagicoccus sp. SDUM812003 TaxID=3041267 RepID=UPI00280E3EE7|nr:alpha/beta hydrolase [Pelagicoccus sp. SDUM812003]MDQ8201790.1 alpha/beta hydrolase [Pelagicoccus sp. SDUM812003]
MNRLNRLRKPNIISPLACVLLALGATALAHAQGIRLEGYPYPFPERVFVFESQRQQLEMVYMDQEPDARERGESVLLLHGKNFSGSYFEETAKALVEQGYRVVMPDQVGFGKSSKPQNYAYSFHQLALNTKRLLEELKIESVHVLGHSMGGMIARRFALMYPESTDTLTLLNPIGLEDWKADGVPYRPIDEWYERELGKTKEKIKEYQLSSYYDGKWKDAYDPWVEQLAAYLDSPNYPRMAWNQALTYDMIYAQPVVYEFPKIEVPTLLIIGQRDRTALGKDMVDPKTKARLGNYPELGQATHEAIRNSELVELEGIGHLPHIEAFERFVSPYLSFLKSNS